MLHHSSCLSFKDVFIHGQEDKEATDNARTRDSGRSQVMLCLPYQSGSRYCKGEMTMRHLLEWDCPKCGLVHIIVNSDQEGASLEQSAKCPVCGTRRSEQIPNLCVSPSNACHICEEHCETDM